MPTETPQTICFQPAAAGEKETEVISLQPHVPERIFLGRVPLFHRRRKPLKRHIQICLTEVLLWVFPSKPLFLFPLQPFLSAGAGLDRHVGVHFKHWVPGFILEEHSQRTHIFWDTAGLGNSRDDPDGSHYALDGGVVGWPYHLKEMQENYTFHLALV